MPSFLAELSLPIYSRENAPSRSEVGRMTVVLVDIFCRSFPVAPAAITLDIDDTCDAVHGHQQLSLFNAFHDTRCLLPVHVYRVESGWPVAVLLCPGKTPSGVEVRTMLKLRGPECPPTAGFRIICQRFGWREEGNADSAHRAGGDRARGVRREYANSTATRFAPLQALSWRGMSSPIACMIGHRRGSEATGANTCVGQKAATR